MKMSDLISREELMKLWDEYHPYIATRAIQFDQAIRKLPSAYPKKGKWIVWDEIIAGIYHTVSECSECGFTTDKMDREEMPYCPYCGARMDEE
jgi:rubrerythrin